MTAKQVALPTGEHLTFWRSAGGTCTVEVRFEFGGQVVAMSTSGSNEDALLALSTRFKTLGHELEKLADKL